MLTNGKSIGSVPVSFCQSKCPNTVDVPPVVMTNESVTFFVTFEPNSKTYTTAINFGDGAIEINVNNRTIAGPANPPIPITHRYEREGVYTVESLAVTETTADECDRPEVMTVTVESAVAGYQISYRSPAIVDRQTEFSVSVAAGSGVTYLLDFGDGQQEPATAAAGFRSHAAPTRISHVFRNKTTYQVIAAASNHVSGSVGVFAVKTVGLMYSLIAGATADAARNNILKAE